MKTLEEYHAIREFLGAQGLQPTVAMLAAPEPEWKDLVYLAESWQTEMEAEAQAREAELEGLSEEELALHEKMAEEKRRLEQEELLYHSSGHRPGRK